MVHDDSNMDFGELFEASTRQPGDRPLFPGEEVKGKVVLITGDAVFIDYGSKSEGWAELEEFLNEKGEVGIEVGMDVTLTFIEYGPSGTRLGSCLRKTPGGSGGALLRTAYESGVTIEGTITGTNKGGLEVTISGTKTFCPVSQIDLTYCERPEAYVGTTQKFQVIQFEEDGRNIVVSRRAVLQAERLALAAKTRERLTVGETFPGRVTRLTPFGAFVDLGGIEGMIHVSEISRNTVRNPADHLAIDQEVTAQILSMEKDEKGNERISLSLKALEPDPWETGFEFKDGDTITGTVRNLAAYGAFVEVAPGVEGLVHISEISYKHIHHPKEKLQIDQPVEVKVLEINRDQHRISLSIKEASILSDSEQDQASPPSGTDQGTGLSDKEAVMPLTLKVGLITKAIVRSIKPYGYFVDLPDLGSHQRGLLHSSQLASSEKGQIKKGIKEGTELQVEIIKIDEQGRISLSQKSVLDNQDRADYNEYQDRTKEIGKLGTMGDLFGKFSKK